MPNFLNIYETGKSATGKTAIYSVVNIHAVVLGEIRWKGTWRKYVFYPNNEIVFDSECLMQIVEFLRDKTNAQLNKGYG